MQSKNLARSLIPNHFNSYWRQDSNGCWNWVGNVSDTGYGVLGVQENGKRVSRFAHRFSYELHIEPLPPTRNRPDDVVVMHKCDNRLCVNPKHLTLGTRGDNIRDAASKGRVKKNEDHHNAKLTKRDVKWIRRMYRKRDKDYSARALARRLGVNAGTVEKVVRGETWTNL